MVGGLSGQRMMIGLVIGIILLVILVLKTKVHAFLALIISCAVVGVIGGMPIVDTTLENGTVFGIINSIKNGFGGTLGNIGIIIGFGVMMGQLFEVSGAAEKMAQTFLKLFGKKREEEALALTGFLVSIPIFCDSGFVILAPIAKAISRVTKKSVISLGVALAAGLVITHSLVPPTPGPLGVCGIFNYDVGKYILFSILLALPM
ncbi:MAG: SLC13 family permease, partial [Lachnospiraceae bacterium]